MKRILTLIILMLSALSSIQAQENFTQLSGYVRNRTNHAAVSDAEIHVPGSNVGVITNEDGFFTLKVATMPKELEVAAIGFRNLVFSVSSQKNTDKMDILLTPNTTVLNNVTVYSASNIVRAAVQKIPVTFSTFPEQFSTFYRETVRKKGRYVNLSEAVMEMFKSPYKDATGADHVRIIKGRKLISQRAKDTLAIKVMGGPNEALVLDLAKNRDYLLNEEELNKYFFLMEEGVIMNDRDQYVIRFEPQVVEEDRPLYYGKMYIDKERLAFTRIELSLDVSNTQKATAFMLVHKPGSLRFRPRELTTYINYRFDGNYSRINYIRNVFNFNCDWKKKLMATNYVVVSEMVVTDHSVIQKIPSRKGAFRQYDVLDAKVADFNDPEFWENYNILEPSESLENAVKKLKKRAE